MQIGLRVTSRNGQKPHDRTALPKTAVFGTDGTASKIAENLVPQSLGKTQFDFGGFLAILENRTFMRLAASATLGSLRSFAASWLSDRNADGFSLGP